jgi:hypothetical protein
MKLYLYKLTCKVTECPNSYLDLDVISVGLPENVVCEHCGNQIIDISDPVFYADQEFNIPDPVLYDDQETEILDPPPITE